MIEKSHYSEEQPKLAGYCRYCGAGIYKNADGQLMSDDYSACSHEPERRTQAGRATRGIVDDILWGVRE